MSQAVLAKANEYRAVFAPGASNGEFVSALAWAVAHARRRFYLQLSLAQPTAAARWQDMQKGGACRATCDCSMFTRWAFAQAGVDIGLTTSTQWTSEQASSCRRDRRLQQTDLEDVARGVGPDPPPSGYQPGDLIFFGVDDGPNGHVAMWLGDDAMIVPVLSHAATARTSGRSRDTSSRPGGCGGILGSRRWPPDRTSFAPALNRPVSASVVP